jgi:thioredoxin-related protein
VAMLALGFVGYLALGLSGKPLTYLSGFPPPTFYSLTSNQECPQGFNCFHSYEKGMAHARKVNKPVMLDFTGWSCVNCRKMEENVWIKPQVHNIIEDKYVLISLYVDEKAKLPPKERYVSDFSGDKITTVGGKWSDFQATRFKANSQPYYVLLDHKGNELLEPRGYTPDHEAYYSYLKKGLNKFRRQNQSTATK